MRVIHVLAAGEGAESPVPGQDAGGARTLGGYARTGGSAPPATAESAAGEGR